MKLCRICGGLGDTEIQTFDNHGRPEEYALCKPCLLASQYYEERISSVYDSYETDDRPSLKAIVKELREYPEDSQERRWTADGITPAWGTVEEYVAAVSHAESLPADIQTRLWDEAVKTFG